MLRFVVSAVAAVCAISLLADRSGPASAATASPPVAYQQICSNNSDRVTVIFLWTPSKQGAQWLDLSLFNNGFASGTFLNAGPLDGSQFAYAWEGLLPGARHYARVNTLTAGGWQPGGTLAFTTGVCHVPSSQPQLIEQHCSTSQAATVSVTLGWTPGGEGNQWLDLSLFANNFAPGTFIGAGPLVHSQSSQVWDGLIPGTTHYVRVNTLTAIGWRVSPTLQFRTISCTSAPRVQLTFDDGGDYTAPILDILGRYGVRVIFFPTGQWAQVHPDLLKRMMAEGHIVGDHTYSHARLTVLSPDKIRAEIAGGNIGNSDLFRPPYDAFNSTVSAIVTEMGFRMFLWNLDPRDWARTYAGGDAEIVDAVVNHAFPGAVVILHLEVRNTVLALPRIIEGLRAKGYLVGS
jgi:peptidoglycan/xylan/chitin deacetylase (PgdA/CDA1 family)